MTFQGKVIAITGGASGIGLSTAKRLRSLGAIVCICDVNPAAFTSAYQHFHEDASPLEFMCSIVDVSDSGQVNHWIDEILEEHKRLDGAVNSAGIIGKHHGVRKVEELENEEWDRIMSVNLTGMMYCLRKELQVLGEGASVVNVASVQGTMGFPKSGAYSASKHGVIGLTLSAAKEVGERSIRVNAVAPGSIQTPMMDHAREVAPDEGVNPPVALGRIGLPEEIASIIVFLLSEEASYVTGQVWGGDGGWGTGR